MILLLLAGTAHSSRCRGDDRIETFDVDPGWEGKNNRTTKIPARMIRQDFGFSAGTRHAGGRGAGELGGLITPAAEPAYYAKRIPRRTLADRLRASGTLACGDGPVHVLIGFFNSATVNEWRTPNTIALRIQGRGEKFFGYLEYATSRWRAGGDYPRPFARETRPSTGKNEPRGFPARGAVHLWSLDYDPRGADGRGAITATIDGESSVCELAPGHREDGAEFDRFGVLTVLKSADTPGNLWLDDIEVADLVESFDRDPGWEEVGNRRVHATTNIRPRFDFGFSASRFAGGAASGELGGLVFRGDIRDPDRMASYGDRVRPLKLDRPLRASGTLALRRAVSDSTTLLGFYDSRRSLAANPSQASGFPEHFVGLAVEGPSREGFFVYPAYRINGDIQGYADGDDRPRVVPNGVPHRWDLTYRPSTGQARGRLTVAVDGIAAHVELLAGADRSGETFDRFGIISTWIDGNGQSIFFDDLTYTYSQER